MATGRINKEVDATWSRAWEVDDAAGRIALLATSLTPLGPKRGDMIVQLDTTTIYIVVSGSLVVPLTPIDLTSGVTGVLPAANLPPTFDWQPVPFSAGDFTASGAMTWTVGSGNITVNRFGLSYDGLTAIWNFSLNGYTIGGTPDLYLRIAFPFGAVPNSFFLGALGFCADSGVGQTGFAWVAAGGQAFIEIGLMSGANWAAGGPIGEVDFTVMYEVQP